MPAEHGVGRGDRCDVPQGGTAHSLRARGEASPIVVGHTQPTPAQLAPQQPVFFDQVGDRLPFPTFQPAGQHQSHHRERRGVDHEPELIAQAGL